VFIVGCGRSGTHLLAHTLAAHPRVRATIEAEPMFGLSTALAMNVHLEPAGIPQLVRHYEGELRRSAGRLYVDKSHPNLWIAERLRDAFPGALFLGIERDAFATVASMMKHRGVAAWHARWKEFPVPNRFLGITPELAAVYDELPLASRCALRWRAHKERLAELGRVLGPDLAVVSFEAFAGDPAATVRRLGAWLDLEPPLAVPAIDRAALGRWSAELSAQDQARIRDVVGECAAPAA
jgi:hypothetical protein